MTPSLAGFLAEKIGAFLCEIGTLQIDLSKIEPYFEVTILDSYSW